MSEEYGDEYAGEVDTPQTGDVTQPTPFDRFKQYAMERAQLDQSFVQADLADTQLGAILASASADDVFAALEMAGLIGLRELANGTEIQINGYHLVPGNRDEYKNRLGVFAVLEAQMIEDGTEAMFDTGVERIIAALRAWEALGSFPVQVTINKITTGNGEMITLRPLSRRATSA
jgi:hypothetical protein